MRPSWNQYFLEIAKVVATRSQCLRAKHGAVIVDQQNRILSTGYNNPLPGKPSCEELGSCLIVERLDGRPSCHRTFHAEANALSYLCKENDKPYKIYITGTPCVICLEQILKFGIKHIVCGTKYGEESDYHKRLLTAFGATIEYDKC